MILDYRQADLGPSDRTLCDFAVKLTLCPGGLTALDIETLRGQGFTDEAITIAVQTIAYFNYINRVAEALGVDPEPWMTMSSHEWRARKGRDYAWEEPRAIDQNPP